MHIPLPIYPKLSPNVSIRSCWVLGAGSWVLGAGCWVLGAGSWELVQVAGLMTSMRTASIFRAPLAFPKF